MDTEEFAKPLYINLYNFEDGKFRDNRYVLTSPRSLQACDEVKVKPADLLYKPLSEYQDELDGQIPFEQILERYNNREQRRLEKLSLVRQRRTEIVDEQNSTGSSPVPEITSEEEAEILTTDFHADTERTKWAVSGADMKHSTFIKDDNENVSRKLLDLDISEVEKADSEKSEKSDDRRRVRTLTPGSSHRSLTSSRRSVTSSQRSVTSWPEREILTAGKIKDESLRKELNDSQLTITSHDEKILAALVRKREDERRQDKLRQLARVAYEESRDRARHRHEAQTIARKHRLADLNSTRDRVRLEREAELNKQYDDVTRMRRQKSTEKQSRWEKYMDNVNEKSTQQLLDRKHQEMERKKSQEQRKEAKEEELGKYHQMVNQYQMAALERACEKKDQQLITKKQRVAEKNMTEQQQQRERLAKVEREQKLQEESMRSSIAVKHLRAEKKLEKIGNKRRQGLEEKKRAEEERLNHSKSAVEHRDKVLKNYYSELSQYQRMREDQAIDVHNQTLEKKKIRAVEERRRWEEIQRQNKKKVAQSEAARQREMLESIELKDFRSQRVNENKQQTAQQLRTLAYNSSVLRAQLREKYQKDSFDKKCQKVELDVRMGLGGI